LCLELDVASQGRSLEEALANLREAIELYLEGEEEIVQPEPPFITFVEVA
jgi:predicted RNase H-like HicB family nuclease